MSPLAALVARFTGLTRRTPGRTTCAVAATLWLVNCASVVAPAVPVQAVDAHNDNMALDGVVVAAEPNPLLNLSVYGPDELFHMAREFERNKRHNDAETVYRELVREFPKSAFAEPARFNLGLLFEGRDDFKAAAEQYVELVSVDVPSADHPEARRTWLDAHYRLAVAYGKQKDWWRAVRVFDYVLDEPWIDVFDRLEAMVGRGIAIQEAGDAESAEVAFSGALHFYRAAEREGRIDDRGMVAEAAFRMGEISKDRYDLVKLEFPVDLLRERLELKCAELLSAQSRYLRAIRYGDAHTVAAAGFRIGALYEGLYDTVVGLHAPDDLTQEQVEVYHEEVRGRVRILLKKAIMVYEKAMLTGKRAHTAADWVKRLEKSADRVRKLYLQEAAIADAEHGSRDGGGGLHPP